MMRNVIPVLAACLCSTTFSLSRAQETPPATKPPVASGASAPAEGNLAKEQQQIADKFKELKQRMLTMSEATAATDPRRAALLKQAYSQSTEHAIEQKIGDLVKLLEQDQLFKATKDQVEVQQELSKMLDLLLSGDRNKQIASEKTRVGNILKQVNQLIKEQKGIQGQTSGEGESKELANRQGQLAEKTGKLAKDIQQAEGAPSDSQDKGQDPGGPKPKEESPAKESEPKEGGEPGKNPGKPKRDPAGKPQEAEGQQAPPAGEGQQQQSQGKPGKPDQGQSQESQEEAPQSDAQQPQDEQTPARKRIQAAEQKMKDAQKKLDEAKKNEAVDDQEKAIEELQIAKAELEEILRQLREEEVDRVLAMLETRFRKMLQMQTEVHEGTKRLGSVPQAERGRDDEIEAGRLSRSEAEIVVEADKALNIMKEEGTSVAFPEAAVQMRADMQQVVEWLGKAEVGDLTQGVEQDIITALEEMIAALQQAQKEQKEQQQMPGGEGEAGEPPLVDKLAEIRMIRALQMRVNNRHEQYSKLVKSEQVEQPDLLHALDQLAERQARIHSVTRDIVTGRNQ